MWTYLKQKWQNESIIKVITMACFLILISGIVIQFTGANPNDLGEIIYGDRDDELSLNSNELMIHSFTINLNHGVVGFGSNEILNYHLFDHVLANESEFQSDLALETGLIKSGDGDEVSIWFDEVGEFSLVLVNENSKSVDYVVEARQYSEEEYRQISTYSIGTWIRNLAIIGFVFYMVIWVLIPWLRYREYGKEKA